MKRLSIPSLLALALVATACERHSASSLPSHGAHAAGGDHAEAPHAEATPKQDAPVKEAPAKEAPAKEAPAGVAPKFFEQQPGK
jgi:hypothetical protein